ncbi:hypothetical protein [Shewanella sp. 6_MG-2023]|uniref:hypothetical protein n=1 Tax=Shewanella sp. 6_MG-2023 TaxID=3062660 RepID=UPI0026E302D6|nr:hypothetical protein [Shewanella sp. 6_MG-2023]MDO6621082.1 hypothetical protein [Shewanella sp. 6_MG-2023]
MRKLATIRLFCSTELVKKLNSLTHSAYEINLLSHLVDYAPLHTAEATTENLDEEQFYIAILSDISQVASLSILYLSHRFKVIDLIEQQNNEELNIFRTILENNHDILMLPSLNEKTKIFCNQGNAANIENIKLLMIEKILAIFSNIGLVGIDWYDVLRVFTKKRKLLAIIDFYSDDINFNDFQSYIKAHWQAEFPNLDVPLSSLCLMSSNSWDVEISAIELVFKPIHTRGILTQTHDNYTQTGAFTIDTVQQVTSRAFIIILI